MELKVLSSIDELTSEAWNGLEGGIDNPFVRHEFLAALEHNGCLGKRWGWLPRHLALFDGDRLVGATPLYIKYNSYGEFVFDWSWADAYQRAGLHYYPKLVSAVPYTPATGPRLLAATEADRKRISEQLIEGALSLAREHDFSSLHWLFLRPQEGETLAEAGFMRRIDCQFHWRNRGYRDFDDFLDGFTSEKRKKLRRERRRVREADVELEVLNGHTATDEHWTVFHRFYESTFDKRGGYATLTLDFFREVARTMPERVVLVMARHRGRYVAGALNFRSDDTLYGRHWGCEEEFHSLHFEACYYAGIDYCIREGLSRFEPGAQGEHKLSRGFEPTMTTSMHWIAHPQFARAVGDVLVHERSAMQEYIEEMRGHLPFRDDGEGAD